MNSMPVDVAKELILLSSLQYNNSNIVWMRHKLLFRLSSDLANS